MTPYRAAAEAWAEMARFPYPNEADDIERTLRSNPDSVTAMLGYARSQRARALLASNWIETPTSLAAGHLARILSALVAQLKQTRHEAAPPDGISRAYLAPPIT